MKSERTLGIILPAAGVGRRFGGRRPKQFCLLAGSPVLAHSVRFFARLANVRQIVIAIPEKADKGISQCRKVLEDLAERIQWVPGGNTRQRSVEIAISHMSAECEWIAVHDAARPLLDRSLFRSLWQAARITGAAIPGLAVTDTLKRVGARDRIEETVPRANLFAVQTPQIFRRDLLLAAFQKAHQDSFLGTDESSLVERLGVPVTLVPGSRRNLKITLSADLTTAEWILQNPKWK